MEKTGVSFDGEAARMVLPAYWRAMCPDLSITSNPFQSAGVPYPIPPEQVHAEMNRVVEDGYYRIPGVVPREETFVLADAVRRIVAQGIPAPFLLVYDEIWQVLSRFESFLDPLLGDDYCLTRDIWVYYIRASDEAPSIAKEEHGWPPHRDGIERMTTLREDGRPKVVTMWIPLTDVGVDDSCMYVLPASKDPHFPDHLGRFDVPQAVLSDIRAQPLAAGGLLGWNEYTLHWGSRPGTRAKSRISVAVRYQSKDMESIDMPYLDPAAGLTFEDRLGVIGRVLHRYREHYASAPPIAHLGQVYAQLYEAAESVRRLGSQRG